MLPLQFLCRKTRRLGCLSRALLTAIICYIDYSNRSVPGRIMMRCAVVAVLLSVLHSTPTTAWSAPAAGADDIVFVSILARNSAAYLPEFFRYLQNQDFPKVCCRHCVSSALSLVLADYVWFGGGLVVGGGGWWVGGPCSCMCGCVDARIGGASVCAHDTCFYRGGGCLEEAGVW